VLVHLGRLIILTRSIRMYKKSFSSQPRFRSHRPAGGFRRRQYGKNNASDESISSSRYTNKAMEQKEEAPYVPTHTFADFALNDRLKQNIIARGYTTPTPIQDQAIPVLLEGRDVIGIANTGTGKTAAFLLPLINKIMTNPEEKALILVPTRELAVQVEDEFRAFSKGLQVRAILCIGGASITQQMFFLRKNPHIVIGTPGRIKDLIERNALRLTQFKNVVLDEVDRMVDIGFIHDVKYMVSLMSPTRQSFFFTATVSRDIEPIVASFLNDPVTVSVKKNETAAHIEQDVIHVKTAREKLDKLTDMLKNRELSKVLVFVRTKKGAEQLAKTLDKEGYFSSSIHGNKTQGQRMRALRDFKENKIKVLVATDVAARGIDIPDVTHVINFDEPGTYTDYVHRIGRTGRATKSGKAFTFVIR